MIIKTEIDYETGDTTVTIDLGNKTFSLKVNLNQIRDKIDVASSNWVLQRAMEAIAGALGVEIKIEDKQK